MHNTTVHKDTVPPPLRVAEMNDSFRDDFAVEFTHKFLFCVSMQNGATIARAQVGKVYI